MSTFSQYGNVERITVVTDRETGQPCGFAFEMNERDDAETAILVLNGSELNDRSLNVSEARPKTQGGGFSNSRPRSNSRGNSRW